jgi:hypothetical protein
MIKRRGVQLLNFLLLALPNQALHVSVGPLVCFFITLTSPVEGSLQIFERTVFEITVFERTTYRECLRPFYLIQCKLLPLTNQIK